LKGFIGFACFLYYVELLWKITTTMAGDGHFAAAKCLTRHPIRDPGSPPPFVVIFQPAKHLT
jgi:hypothetical protein